MTRTKRSLLLLIAFAAIALPAALTQVQIAPGEITATGPWSIQVSQFESDGNGDGRPDVVSTITPLSSTTLEIFVNDTREQGAYKWRAAICNVTGASVITKEEFNPATEVWTNTGPLSYSNVTNFGYPSTWCAETGGLGYALFGAGSGDKRYRLNFAEGDKTVVFYTGEGTEIIVVGSLGHLRGKDIVRDPNGNLWVLSVGRDDNLTLFNSTNGILWRVANTTLSGTPGDNSGHARMTANSTHLLVTFGTGTAINFNTYRFSDGKTGPIVTSICSGSAAASKVVQRPNGTLAIFANTQNYCESTNGGTTWTTLKTAADFPFNANSETIDLIITPDNTSHLIALPSTGNVSYVNISNGVVGRSFTIFNYGSSFQWYDDATDVEGNIFAIVSRNASGDGRMIGEYRMFNYSTKTWAANTVIIANFTDANFSYPSIRYDVATGRLYAYASSADQSIGGRCYVINASAANSTPSFGSRTNLTNDFPSCSRQHVRGHYPYTMPFDALNSTNRSVADLVAFNGTDLGNPIGVLIYFNASLQAGGGGAPVLLITHPSNATYNSSSVPLNWTTSKDVDWSGYQLDGAAELTISDICFQEHANVSTSCGGLSTGTYGNNSNWNNIGNLRDGDLDTGAGTADGIAEFYINYTKPDNVEGTSLWQVKDNDGTANLTVPSACWDYLADRIVLRVLSTSGVNAVVWYCHNDTGWDNLRSAASSSVAYEEAMYWNRSAVNITLTSLAAGPHTVKIRANDSAGAMGESQTVSFTVAFAARPSADFSLGGSFATSHLRILATAGDLDQCQLAGVTAAADFTSDVCTLTIDQSVSATLTINSTLGGNTTRSVNFSLADNPYTENSTFAHNLTIQGFTKNSTIVNNQSEDPLNFHVTHASPEGATVREGRTFNSSVGHFNVTSPEAAEDWVSSIPQFCGENTDDAEGARITTAWSKEGSHSLNLSWNTTTNEGAGWVRAIGTQELLSVKGHNLTGWVNVTNTSRLDPQGFDVNIWSTASCGRLRFSVPRSALLNGSNFINVAPSVATLNYSSVTQIEIHVYTASSVPKMSLYFDDLRFNGTNVTLVSSWTDDSLDEVLGSEHQDPTRQSEAGVIVYTRRWLNVTSSNIFFSLPVVVLNYSNVNTSGFCRAGWTENTTLVNISAAGVSDVPVWCFNATVFNMTRAAFNVTGQVVTGVNASGTIEILVNNTDVLVSYTNVTVNASNFAVAPSGWVTLGEHRFVNVTNGTFTLVNASTRATAPFAAFRAPAAADCTGFTIFADYCEKDVSVDLGSGRTRHTTTVRHVVNVSSNLAVDSEIVAAMPLSRFTNWAIRNDDSEAATVNGSSANLSVASDDDFVNTTVGTNHSASSLHMGYYLFDVSYDWETQVGQSPGSGAGGGGGGGGGGSPQLQVPGLGGSSGANFSINPKNYARSLAPGREDTRTFVLSCTSPDPCDVTVSIQRYRLDQSYRWAVLRIGNSALTEAKITIPAGTTLNPGTASFNLTVRVPQDALEQVHRFDIRVAGVAGGSDLASAVITVGDQFCFTCIFGDLAIALEFLDDPVPGFAKLRVPLGPFTAITWGNVAAALAVIFFSVGAWRFGAGR